MARNPNSILNSLTKVNDMATNLKDDKIANIEQWIPTGSYALNSIVSGDLFKGIPCGRITTLFGPSQSGKSFISAMLQKNALDMGITPIIFDSEFDKDGRMEESLGINTEEVGVIPVETVEQTITQMNKLMQMILDKKEQGKYLIILDSLGALSTDKEMNDASNDKVAQDMGLKAKLIKAFYRTMKGKCALTKCPLVVVNHEIENPNELHKSVFKQQGGGNAIEFFSTVMINVAKKKEKKDASNDRDEALGVAKKDFSGQIIRLFTHKNRLVIPHLEVETYLNFVNGFDEYSGLKDIATKCNVIINKGRTYSFIDPLKEGAEEESIGFYKTWRHDEKFWKEKVFPVLNPVINRDFSYRPTIKRDET